MTAPNNQPVSGEDLIRFANYLSKNPSWGSLHIVLADNNIRDSDVQFCIDQAREEGDTEGEYLGKVLLTLSKSQRYNLPRRL